MVNEQLQHQHEHHHQQQQHSPHVQHQQHMEHTPPHEPRDLDSPGMHGSIVVVQVGF